jgi:hypothetical protein
MTKQGRRSLREAPPGSTRQKGDIVEEVVAKLHKSPGITVERGVYLPTIDRSGRRREIDILLIASVSGYPIQIAIECKNETKPVGVEEIDEFIGKLNDVGIPLSLGVFVSRSGYKKGVAARANQAGIKPLVLIEISGLEHAVRKALQSLIYLLLSVESISITNNIPDVKTNSGDMLFFRDKDGNVVGGIADLIWNYWNNGKIPITLGRHKIELNIPNGWLQVINGQIAEVKNITTVVCVRAHVITFLGDLQHYSLRNSISSEEEKFLLSAKFQPPEGMYEVHVFEKEDELLAYLTTSEGINISIGRFPLPKIQYGPLYWPPSKKSIDHIWNLFKQTIESGSEFDISKMNLSDIEGSDLSAIWEPIWSEHPAVKSKNKQE